MFFFVFFFNVTAATEIYTLSLHDALPISLREALLEDLRGLIDERVHEPVDDLARLELARRELQLLDRKSTRLNSSHVEISYAVFCLKKKTKKIYHYLY